MLIRFWISIYGDFFISFLPVYVAHIVWIDRIGICLICISLTVFCEKLSLPRIKYLFSTESSTSDWKFAKTKCFFFSSISFTVNYMAFKQNTEGHFSYWVFQCKADWLIINMGKQKKYRSVRKIIHPNRFKSSGNMYLFAIWLAACRGEGSCHMFPFPRRKGILFS